MSLTALEMNSSITAPPTPLIVSEEIYWRDYYEDPETIYEWNNGILEEKPVSDYETFLIYAWFVDLLRRFLQTYPIASLTGLEMGFRFTLPNNKIIVRKPDLGIVLNTNPVQLQNHDMRYHGIFDLCIEALSDSTRQERERDTLIKKTEYAAAGIREYFILHNTPLQECYRLNEKGIYLPIVPTKNGVIQSQVLPGFEFRREDLWNRPNVEEMIDDPVYQKFVFPNWQLERKLRREAEQRVAVLQSELEQIKSRNR